MKITSSFRSVSKTVAGTVSARSHSTGLYIGVLLFCATILNTGCTDQDNDSQEHVWQQQTDTLDKARAVEGILQDSADEKRRQIEQQTK